MTETLKRLRDYLAEIREFHSQFDPHSPVTVHTSNSLGDTPLHVAVRRGDIQIVGDMLGAGADINARGEFGGTPLRDAALCGHTEIVRFLLARGASTSIADDNGRTPLDIATTGTSDIMMDLLRNQVT